MWRSVVHAAVIAAIIVVIPDTDPFAQQETSSTQNRPDVSGREAAVVCDHPLAAAAGYEALRKGGNAIDAAVTMAGVAYAQFGAGAPRKEAAQPDAA